MTQRVYKGGFEAKCLKKPDPSGRFHGPLGCVRFLQAWPRRHCFTLAMARCDTHVYLTLALAPMPIVTNKPAKHDTEGTKQNNPQDHDLKNYRSENLIINFGQNILIDELIYIFEPFKEAKNS